MKLRIALTALALALLACNALAPKPKAEWEASPDAVIIKATITSGADAPKAFSELFALVSGGAGATGADFEPTTGYLKAYPTGDATGQEPYHWPDESLGFGLDEVGNGKWIGGEALAFAWQIVNESYYIAVESGGQGYQLVAQVPGISYLEPPEP